MITSADMHDALVPVSCIEFDAPSDFWCVGRACTLPHLSDVDLNDVWRHLVWNYCRRLESELSDTVPYISEFVGTNVRDPDQV